MPRTAGNDAIIAVAGIDGITITSNRDGVFAGGSYDAVMPRATGNDAVITTAGINGVTAAIH